MRQRALDAGVFVVLPILVLGLAPGAADDGGTVVENQDVARVAPVRRCAAADVGDEIAGDALVGPENEDALGVRRGELAAARRRAGLIQHRRPLQRRLGQVNGVHLIVAARDAARGGSWRDRRRYGWSCRAARRRLPSSPPTTDRRRTCIRRRRRTDRRGRAGPSTPCRVPRCRDSRSRCSSRPGRLSGGPASTCDGRTDRAARRSGWR